MSLRFSKGGGFLALCRQSALELAHRDLFESLRIDIVRPHRRGFRPSGHMDHRAKHIGTAAGELDQDLRS